MNDDDDGRGEPQSQGCVLNLSPLPADRTSGISKWDANDYDQHFRSPGERPYPFPEYQRFFNCPRCHGEVCEALEDDEKTGMWTILTVNHGCQCGAGADSAVTMVAFETITLHNPRGDPTCRIIPAVEKLGRNRNFRLVWRRYDHYRDAFSTSYGRYKTLLQAKLISNKENMKIARLGKAARKITRKTRLLG